MMTQSWLPIECSPVGSVTLCAADMERLRQAGAGASEIEAVQRAPDAGDRAALMNFFTFICPQNFRRLRAAVRLVRWDMGRGDPSEGGADIVYNAARFIFRDFGHGGSNDERCFITRALAVVDQDIAKVVKMKPDGKANILLDVGWYPSGQIDWSIDALPPLLTAELVQREMPH